MSDTSTTPTTEEVTATTPVTPEVEPTTPVDVPPVVTEEPAATPAS